MLRERMPKTCFHLPIKYLVVGIALRIP